MSATPDRRRSGAQILWEALRREGVEVVFGYPGGAIMPAYDALLDSPIKHVLVRHEQGAAHMADGYARASGKVGVAIATSGPGATNLVTGIATAMLDSVPIVCITGQVPSHVIGTDAFQETDITGVTLPITKHNYLVTQVDQIAPTIREAFYVARSGRPGPVLVDITKDAQQRHTVVEWSDAPVCLPGYRPERAAQADDLARAAAMIDAAKRPVILAGHGIVKAGGERAARRSRRADRDPGRRDAARARRVPGVAPAVARHDGHARRGLGQPGDPGGRSPDRARHAVRRPRHRQPGDVRAGRQEDPLRARSGGDQQDRAGRPRAGRRRGRHAARARCRGSPHTERRAWVDRIAQLRGDSAVRDIQRLPPNGRLFAAHVLHDLWRITEGKALVVTDVGQHQMWEAQYYKHDHPRKLLTSGGLGTMGFALPAAIGARFADPDAEIWVVAGDGGFQMTACELSTAAQEGIKLNIAIINNGYLGMVRQWQEFFYDGRYSATPLRSPDFVKLAEAHGLTGLRVTRREEVEGAVAAARAMPGTVLVDFRVEQEDSVYPMVPAGADLHDMIRRPSPIVETADD